MLRREPDGSLVEHADLSPLSRYQINDMVVDPHGHAFVGQMGYDLHGGGGASAQPAALLRVDPDGSTHEAADGMRVANGMAVANDDRTLDRRRERGQGPRRVRHRRRRHAVQPPRLGRAPRLSRRHVHRRRGRRVVRVPGRRPVHPGRRGRRGDRRDRRPRPARDLVALGGADGHTLFMLTAPTLGNPEGVPRRDGRPHRDHRRHRPRCGTAVTMERGLSDIRVVDFSTGIAGAYTTKLFADAGADVVKVEPPEGDPLRRWSASGADAGRRRRAPVPVPECVEALGRRAVGRRRGAGAGRGRGRRRREQRPGARARSTSPVGASATPRWSSCRSRPAA